MLRRFLKKKVHSKINMYFHSLLYITTIKVVVSLWVFQSKESLDHHLQITASPNLPIIKQTMAKRQKIPREDVRYKYSLEA